MKCNECQGRFPEPGCKLGPYAMCAWEREQEEKIYDCEYKEEPYINEWRLANEEIDRSNGKEVER